MIDKELKGFRAFVVSKTGVWPWHSYYEKTAAMETLVDLMAEYVDKQQAERDLQIRRNTAAITKLTECLARSNKGVLRGHQVAMIAEILEGKRDDGIR